MALTLKLTLTMVVVMVEVMEVVEVVMAVVRVTSRLTDVSVVAGHVAPSIAVALAMPLVAMRWVVQMSPGAVEISAADALVVTSAGALRVAVGAIPHTLTKLVVETTFDACNVLPNRPPSLFDPWKEARSEMPSVRDPSGSNLTRTSKPTRTSRW